MTADDLYGRVGAKVDSVLELASEGAGSGHTGTVGILLEGMQKYFAAEVDCDENFLFAYINGTIAGM
jgi:hypothetical protein